MTRLVMIDAIRINAHNIPKTTPRVAGYVTGTGVVPWDGITWSLFPQDSRVRIDQSPSLSVFKLGHAYADVADVEDQAGTVAAFVEAVKERKALDIWSTIYGTDSTIAQARAALNAAGPHGWYYGHVDCWLADWNLDEQQAAAVVGTMVHGLTCRAVQWASPTSNPDTVVPGSGMTLTEAQVDLSVASSSWPRV